MLNLVGTSLPCHILAEERYQKSSNQGVLIYDLVCRG